MVILGYDNTQPVTMEDMTHHCKAVRRGAPSRFIVGDMPFGSYEVSTQEAVRNAMDLVKKTGVDAIKLEGAGNIIIITIHCLICSTLICGYCVM